MAREAGAFVNAGAGESEVFINDDYLLIGPAQVAGAIGQGILARGRFTVVLDLRRSGLANVNEGGTLRVRGLDL